MDHCIICGGHGLKDKVCECGRQPRGIIAQNIKTPTVTKVSGDIPEYYKEHVWHGQVLRDSHKDLSNDLLFDKFVNQLEKIHNMFSAGSVMNKSAIIIAPPKFSKVTFAYSCMQRAYERGYSVAPLLDTQEVKRLITLAADRPLKDYKGVNYDDYISKDVCFITVTKTSYREEAYQVIQEILDKRSRRGLPTFFISRYSLDTLSRRDWDKSFQGILDMNNVENSLKYPAVLTYWVSGR